MSQPANDQPVGDHVIYRAKSWRQSASDENAEANSHQRIKDDYLLIRASMRLDDLHKRMICERTSLSLESPAHRIKALQSRNGARLLVPLEDDSAVLA